MDGSHLGVVLHVIHCIQGQWLLTVDRPQQKLCARTSRRIYSIGVMQARCPASAFQFTHLGRLGTRLRRFGVRAVCTHLTALRTNKFKPNHPNQVLQKNCKLRHGDSML